MKLCHFFIFAVTVFWTPAALAEFNPRILDSNSIDPVAKLTCNWGEGYLATFRCQVKASTNRVDQLVFHQTAANCQRLGLNQPGTMQKGALVQIIEKNGKSYFLPAYLDFAFDAGGWYRAYSLARGAQFDILFAAPGRKLPYSVSIFTANGISESGICQF